MRSYPTSKVRRGGEELPHVQGQEGRRGATPRPRSGAAERSYPTSKVRRGGEELPHVQGQE